MWNIWAIGKIMRKVAMVGNACARKRKISKKIIKARKSKSQRKARAKKGTMISAILKIKVKLKTRVNSTTKGKK